MSRSSFILKSITAAIILASTNGIAFAGSHHDLKGEACPAIDVLPAGFYIGGQVGYDAYRVHRYQDLPLGVSTLTSGSSAGAMGFVGGMMVGYGMVFANSYYLGAELNANYSAANGTTSVNLAGPSPFNDSISTEVNGSYGVSLLPGYRFASNYMGYVRLGWNWVNMRERVQVIIPGLSNNIATNTNTSNGFVFGLGMEGVIMGNWSLRGEYNHTWYSNFSVNSPIIGSSTVSPSDNQFMVGVLYHIG